MGLSLRYWAAPQSKRNTTAFGFAAAVEIAIESEIPLTFAAPLKK
jgi:hypothetical protein